MSSSIAAAASITIVPRSVLGGQGYTAPSDELTKAIIGVGGMGKGHIDYSGSRLLAVCDVDQVHLREALAKAGEGVDGYRDFREVLDRPDIDIVHIAAPPHWHSLIAVAAANAGKDIWCEKPMTRTIGEGRRVVEAVQRNGRIFRLNTWFRFRSRFYGMETTVEEIKKVVESGMLGWPLKVTVSGITGFDWKFFWSGLPNLKPEPVPARLDYDMWLGPAPYKPYHPHRVHQSFRGYWDYDGGGLGDMGQHYLDPVQYLLDKDDTSPVEIDIDAPQQHPDAVGSWRRISMKYSDGCEIILDGEQRDQNAAYLEGPDGKLFKGFTSDIPNFEEEVANLPDPEPQQTDFHDSIRTRMKFALNEENGHRSCTIVNLGIIALKLRRKLRFDPEREMFIGDEEANRLIHQPMRAPWHLLLLFTFLCGCSLTGHVHRLDPMVEEIVLEMPAYDSVSENLLNARLLEMGSASILDVCRMLVPPGTGDDTAARYALSSLAGYVGRPGAESERALYAGVLLAALREASDSEVKSFMIRQLQLAGRDEAVLPLGKYLTDERLCEPSAQALMAIRTKEVEGVLLEALPSVSGSNRITIVKALGELRSKAAAYEILKFTASSDRDLREAALFALANIGPVSTGALLAEAATSSFGLEKANAVLYQLLYAERLAETGNTEESARICRELITIHNGEGEENIRIAALTMLVKVAGGSALDDLAAAAVSRSRAVSSSALTLALDMPALPVAPTWLRVQESAVPDLRSRIRVMLQERHKLYPEEALKSAIAEWTAVGRPVEWVGLDSLAMVEEGFESLFSGIDLRGWAGNTSGYIVEEGIIAADPESEGSGNLYTEREFSDFIFRFQFKLTPDANNGLGIRTPLEGNAAYVGMELQILDNSAEMYRNLRPYQYHGSIYGVVPARRGFQRPVGEWNTQEVIADGSHIKVILNGVVIVDADIIEAGTPETMDGRDHPGLERRSGHIGFLGHGYRVEFRNIWVKEIR